MTDRQDILLIPNVLSPYLTKVMRAMKMNMCAYIPHAIGLFDFLFTAGT